MILTLHCHTYFLVSEIDFFVLLLETWRFMSVYTGGSENTVFSKRSAFPLMLLKGQSEGCLVHLKRFGIRQHSK
jgi:hypothetical protein